MFKKIMFIAVIAFTANKSFCQGKLYLDKIQKLRESGYTISDQYKVNCSQGIEGASSRYFYKGVEYIIVGCSDDQDVSDVDLFLTDSEGTELRRDADASNLAVLNFVPNYSVSLRVRIKNYKSATPNFASTLRFVVAYR